MLNKLTRFGRHRHPIDIIAEINGLLSGIALYPQVVKTFLGGQASALSPFTFLLILINSLVWVVYAFHRSLPQLLLSSSLNAIASVLLLSATVKINV